MNENKKAVFFDCWDTLISFKMKTATWNIDCLKRHSLNSKQVDWDDINLFANSFLKSYLQSGSLYEIQAEQFLNLIVINFKLNLDCTIKECVHEILSSLSPTAIPYADLFLDILNRDGIYHAVLSNTIYDSDDTFKLVNKLLPNNGLQFLLGSAEIGVKKPNKLFFNAGLNKAGIKKENAIYIGDSFYADINGAFFSGFNNVIWLNASHKSSSDYSKLNDFDKISFVDVSSFKEVIELYRGGRLWK